MHKDGQINSASANSAGPEYTHDLGEVGELIAQEKQERRRRLRIVATRLGLTGLLSLALTVAPSFSQSGPAETESVSTGSPSNPNSQPQQTATAPESSPSPTSIETMPPVKPEVQAFPDDRFEKFASWSQDFSTMPDGPLGKKDWNIVDGPPIANEEKQVYTDSLSNVRVENGKLVLEAHKQSELGYNYTSGRVDTLGKEDFQYGKIEVTAKLPVGVGTWPAIWLEPSKNIYNGNPIPSGSNKYYLNGELDIAETSGVDPNVMYCIAHSLKDPTNNPYPEKYFSTLKVPDSDKAFHVYGLSWTPDKITFTIDGNECYSVTKGANDDYTQWPYDQPYHLILNLAIGGKWYTGDPAKYPPDGIDQNMFPVSAQIASVNYFPLAK